MRTRLRRGFRRFAPADACRDEAANMARALLMGIPSLRAMRAATALNPGCAALPPL